MSGKIRKRATRERQSVERYYDFLAPKQKALRIDGEGIILGTSKKISTAIKSLPIQQLIQFHRLFYGSNGVVSERLMNVLAFCGFDQTEQISFDKNKKRIGIALEKKTDEEIEEILKVFALHSGDTKEKNIESITTFIIAPRRPNCDEKVEFIDDVIEQALEQENKEIDDELDASSDDGELYQEGDSDDIPISKNPRQRSTRKRKTAK